MSVSWTYLTRRFAGQNYRDVFAITMIGLGVSSKIMTYFAKQKNDALILVSDPN